MLDPNYGTFDALLSRQQNDDWPILFGFTTRPVYIAEVKRETNEGQSGRHRETCCTVLELRPGAPSCLLYLRELVASFSRNVSRVPYAQPHCLGGAISLFLYCPIADTPHPSPISWPIVNTSVDFSGIYPLCLAGQLMPNRNTLTNCQIEMKDLNTFQIINPIINVVALHVCNEVIIFS